MDNTQPIQYDIEIVKMVIRISRDFVNGGDYAALIGIDATGQEHSFEYQHADGEYYKIAVSSPKEGKVIMKAKYAED